jgi:hypothetical protein
MNKRTGITIGGTRYFMIFPLLWEDRVSGISRRHFSKNPGALEHGPRAEVGSAPAENMLESSAPRARQTSNIAA